jgi:hypothetical protein
VVAKQLKGYAEKLRGWWTEKWTPESGGWYTAEKADAVDMDKGSYRGEAPVSKLEGTLRVFGRFRMTPEEERPLLGGILDALPGFGKKPISRFLIHKLLRDKWIPSAVDYGLLRLVELGWITEELSDKGFVVYVRTEEGWSALERWKGVR